MGYAGKAKNMVSQNYRNAIKGFASPHFCGFLQLPPPKVSVRIVMSILVTTDEVWTGYRIY
jgi:hypothetical protein